MEPLQKEETKVQVASSCRCGRLLLLVDSPPPASDITTPLPGLLLAAGSSKIKCQLNRLMTKPAPFLARRSGGTCLPPPPVVSKFESQDANSMLPV